MNETDLDHEKNAAIYQRLITQARDEIVFPKKPLPTVLFTLLTFVTFGVLMYGMWQKIMILIIIGSVLFAISFVLSYFFYSKNPDFVQRRVRNHRDSKLITGVIIHEVNEADQHFTENEEMHLSRSRYFYLIHLDHLDQVYYHISTIRLNPKLAYTFTCNPSQKYVYLSSYSQVWPTK
jgi:hypothetical protein